MEMTLAIATTKQQQTPEFKRWFKQSKVVDASGNPLRVYHGTRSDFSKFDLKMIAPTIKGLGFHFTGDTLRAGNFGSGDGSNVMPVYLSIQNPYVLELSEQREFAVRYGKYGTEKMQKDFESRGFDGLQLGHDHWVAFRPTQIKSATGNSGKFDARKHDIGE